MARIGLVQTKGVGDILIALPIAAALSRGGNQVLWPVDEKFAGFLRPAAPYAEFLPVRRGEDMLAYLYSEPQRLLRERGCDEVVVLYSQLTGGHGDKVQQPRIAEFLKFDEYKYAVAGVPFGEKWNLRIDRDAAREEALFRSLAIERDYICVHRQGSKFVAEFNVPPQWRSDYQVIEVDERTASPFDWILTLERAAKLVLVDSLFANLVEQLGLPNEKYLLLRSPGNLTPVFRNGWNFLA